MSESERVLRWRQRQREAGKEPVTLWLPTELKLYLEDMALKQRCSPSELVQNVLVQWRSNPSDVTATVTDTVTATVTDTVTATIHQTLPGLVRALLQEQHAGNVSATVTDTVTDTSPIPVGDYISEPAPEHVTDTVTATVVVPMTYPVTVTTTDNVIVPMTYPVTDTVTDTITDTVTDTTAPPPAKRKAPSRQRAVTATVTDTVTVTGATLEPFDTAKYVLGKLCPRGHAWGNTGQSLLRRTNRHCCACDREKFQERGKGQRQARRQQQRQQEERV